MAGAAQHESVELVRRLAVVWCCSVGATWTLELRRPGCGKRFGPIVYWISSSIPVTESEPDELAAELLAAHGLKLFREPADFNTNSQRGIGYACFHAQPTTQK
jgi:hypothetical protein